MYQDISARKKESPIEVDWQHDSIFKKLKKEASHFFAQHNVPANAEEWLKKKTVIKSEILRQIGIWRDPDLDFEAKETGQLACDGYSIKKVFFQTLSQVYITANLYSPDGEGPFPAIINFHGHILDGKLHSSVQERAHLLAQYGFVCLNVDAFGSGERSKIDGESDYHGAHWGASLFDLGYTLLGIQVVENMRAVDWLCSLPFVDSARIGATGESGGGNQAMWLAALDDRIKAVIPVVSVGTFDAYVMAHNCVCELLPAGLTFCEEWQVLGLIAPRALLVSCSLLEKHSAFTPQEMLRSVKKTGKVYQMLGASGQFNVQIFNTEHEYSPLMHQSMLNWFNTHLNPNPTHFQGIVFSPLPKTQLRVFSPGTRPASFGTANAFLHRMGTSLASCHICPNPSDARQELIKILNIRSWDAPGKKITNKHIKKYCAQLGKPLHEGQEPRKLLLNLVASPEDMNRLDITRSANTCTIFLDLWGSGVLNSSVADYFDAQLVPFHTLSRATLWLGKTVIGEWVKQIHNVIQHLRSLNPTLQFQLQGSKEAGLAALYYAALFDDIQEIKILHVPISYVVPADTDLDFYSMAIHVPGIVPWGDLVQVTALVNCPLLIHYPKDVAGVDAHSGMITHFLTQYQALRGQAGSQSKVEFVF